MRHSSSLQVAPSAARDSRVHSLISPPALRPSASLSGRRVDGVLDRAVDVKFTAAPNVSAFPASEHRSSLCVRLTEATLCHCDQSVPRKEAVWTTQHRSNVKAARILVSDLWLSSIPNVLIQCQCRYLGFNTETRTRTIHIHFAGSGFSSKSALLSSHPLF